MASSRAEGSVSVSADCPTQYPSPFSDSRVESRAWASTTGIQGYVSFSGNLGSFDPTENFIGDVIAEAHADFTIRLLQAGSGFVRITYEQRDEHQTGTGVSYFSVNGDPVSLYQIDLNTALVPVVYKNPIYFSLSGMADVFMDDFSRFDISITDIRYYDSAGNLITNPQFVPEPGTWALCGAGLLGLWWRRKRDNR